MRVNFKSWECWTWFHKISYSLLIIIVYISESINKLRGIWENAVSGWLQPRLWFIAGFFADTIQFCQQNWKFWINFFSVSIFDKKWESEKPKVIPRDDWPYIFLLHLILISLQKTQAGQLHRSKKKPQNQSTSPKFCKIINLYLKI